MDIAYNNSVNQDVDNLLIKAVNVLNIPEFMGDRAKFVLAKTWNNKDQKQNYNKIKYELAAMACLMVCCYQDMPEDTVINFDEYIGKLYSQDQTKRIKQFRKAHKNICKFLHLH